MIFVSIGHYPERPGACYHDFCEHGEAAIWAYRLVVEMGYNNATLCPIGTLKEKVAFINDRYAAGDIAIEIHFNSAKNADGVNIGSGSECLYFPKSKWGKELAQVVQDALIQDFLPDRGVKEGYYQLNPLKGVDFFLAKTLCTAIIIEPDFIQHQEKIQARRDSSCSKIAQSLLSYTEKQT